MGRGAAKEGEREGSVLKEAIQFVGMWRGVDCGEGRAVGRKGEGEMGERRTRSARGVCIPVSCSKVCVPHLHLLSLYCRSTGSCSNPICRSEVSNSVRSQSSSRGSTGSTPSPLDVTLRQGTSLEEGRGRGRGGEWRGRWRGEGEGRERGWARGRGRGRGKSEGGGKANEEF